MVFLGGFSLLVSTIGLYILLFASFAPKDEQQPLKNFIHGEARKIRIRKDTSNKENTEPKKPSPQFIMLLETIGIGEIVGLFFLGLTKNQLKFSLLTLNAGFLLLASLSCSVLTLFNVWLKKKTNIRFRMILQIVTLIFGFILAKLGIRDQTAVPSLFFIAPYYFFYSTVVIALLSMLISVIRGNKSKKTEFNFSNYLLLVIISGLLIGTGLYFTSSLRF